MSNKTDTPSEEENTAHTHAMTDIIETGDEEEVQMILGNRERIRSAGTIRAGVKTLKGNPSAAIKNKFAELEAQGLPFDEIDKQLGGKPRSAQSMMRPMNVDHFVIRECDFKNSSDARFIRDNYADDDGHVRRIPIWFSRDEIDKVIPHRFSAFDGGSKVRAASFYRDGVMWFRYIPKSMKDPKEDDWIEVQADDPDEVTKLCGHKVQFGGLYRVNVVGLKTFGEVIVPTRSWYGLGDAVAVMKRVQSILGRTKGLVGGAHFLELVKVPERMRNPDGKMVTQHIITIDAAVDPMILAAHAEGGGLRGVQAIDAFNAGSAQPTAPATKTTPPKPPAAPSVENASQGESEPQVEIASEESLKKTKDYLGGICERYAVDWDAIDAYVFSINKNSLTNMSEGQLRDVCVIVRDAVKKDSAAFIADAIDALRTLSDGEPTEPEFPFGDEEN